MVVMDVAELKRFLRAGDDDNGLLSELLDGAEALFLEAVNREGAPFGDALSARVEVHDGTGGNKLFLDYPVATVTTIALGLDSATPDDTLDPAKVTVIVWGVGSRRLMRTDGGVFGVRGVPRYVHVTYDTQADRPPDAGLAIKRAVATVYRQIGSEDASSEKIGGFSHTLAQAMADDEVWQSAVAAHRRYSMV